MWKSAVEFISTIGRGMVVIQVVAFVLGVSGPYYLPAWAWSICVIGAILLLFWAFHKMRLQRDAAQLPSEVRTYGVATRIITVENYGYAFKVMDNYINLRLQPELHAITGVRVKDIQLEMKGKRYETDWQPMKEAISGDIGGYGFTENSPRCCPRLPDIRGFG